MTELGKIGDQNVEFFKGRLPFFCATKSAQPFRSYGRLKIDNGEKKCKNVKNLIFFHESMSLSALFVFYTFSGLAH